MVCNRVKGWESKGVSAEVRKDLRENPSRERAEELRQKVRDEAIQYFKDFCASLSKSKGLAIIRTENNPVMPVFELETPVMHVALRCVFDVTDGEMRFCLKITENIHDLPHENKPAKSYVCAKAPISQRYEKTLKTRISALLDNAQTLSSWYIETRRAMNRYLTTKDEAIYDLSLITGGSVRDDFVFTSWGKMRVYGSSGNSPATVGFEYVSSITIKEAKLLAEFMKTLRQKS